MLLVPLALLAVGADFGLWAFIRDHYARHGHIGIPLDLAAMAVASTGLTVYASISIAKDLRKVHVNGRARLNERSRKKTP